MKKTIILFLSALLLFAGCVTQPSQQELANLDYGAPPLEYRTTIPKYFEKTLFDPYSAHYDFQSPEQFWYKEPLLAGGRLYAGWLIRVGVNAKNRFGGYVGEQTYGFIFKGEEIIKELEPVDLENMRHIN